MSPPFQVKCPCCSHEFTFRRKSPKRDTVENRFWRNVLVEPNTGCFLWHGQVNTGGYGQLLISSDDSQSKSKNKMAHHISWEMFKGPILNGMNVCHSCDTKRCVNPDHLWAGTQKENMIDATRKGLVRSFKLNDEQVLAIRRMRTEGKTLRALADEFGVSSSAICGVLKGKPRRQPRVEA